ncbi:hypothetical protein ANN_23738 [Periplaneta americana]|uniref:Uncharacterized protein n=1 Tax=Periplaneta americana TaxID=6978 RepID=A0ABQ8SLY7_PERAM|nr:hypothetical protein ANN_23738 [Periplaneta americana]
MGLVIARRGRRFAIDYLTLALRLGKTSEKTQKGTQPKLESSPLQSRTKTARDLQNDLYMASGIQVSDQTDKARAHTAAVTRDFLRENEIESLLRPQTSTYIKMNDNGNTVRANPKYKRRKQYTEELLCRYRYGNITRISFLQRVAYYYPRK